MHAPVLKLGSATFEWGRQTYLMGIINVTPNSFSGDGMLRRGSIGRREPWRRVWPRWPPAPICWM